MKNSKYIIVRVCLRCFPLCFAVERNVKVVWISVKYQELHCISSDNRITTKAQSNVKNSICNVLVIFTYCEHWQREKWWQKSQREIFFRKTLDWLGKHKQFYQRSIAQVFRCLRDVFRPFTVCCLCSLEYSAMKNFWRNES